MSYSGELMVWKREIFKTFKTFLFVESPCFGQRRNQSNSRMLVVMTVAMARAEGQSTSQSITLVVVLHMKHYSHAKRDTNSAT